MKMCVWRLVLAASGTLLLAGCGNKETREALDKATNLEGQKQYRDANNVIVDALQAREAKIRAEAGTPTGDTGTDALNKKVQADPEILKMERAQIPLYLYLERPDMASAVYTDILAGSPKDTVVYDTLKDKDPLIRAGGVHILGLMASTDSVAALAAATKDSDQEVRRAAVVALSSIKDAPATVDPLIAALQDSSWFVRSEAAEALGQKHDARAVKPLLDATADSDETVRGSAQAALVFLSTPPDAVAKPDDFVGRLTDPNPKIVVTSAICLALLKDARAVPVLLKMVQSTDPKTRLDAVKGLGETGDPSVLPTLRETLKDPDVNMRGWSIIGLGNLKDEDSIMDLQDIALDDKEPSTIRHAAGQAVNKIKGVPPAPVGP
jgi:HEAT repeat protein